MRAQPLQCSTATLVGAFVLHCRCFLLGSGRSLVVLHRRCIVRETRTNTRRDGERKPPKTTTAGGTRGRRRSQRTIMVTPATKDPGQHLRFSHCPALRHVESVTFGADKIMLEACYGPLLFMVNICCQITSIAHTLVNL